MSDQNTPAEIQSLLKWFNGPERYLRYDETWAEKFADILRVQLDELVRLRADYRTLWGMTFGHHGQPPTDGTPDDIKRLRALYTDLNGEIQ